MPASLLLYRTRSSLLLSAGVRFHDLRCQSTFLWAVVGLILEKSVHLGQLRRHHPGETKQASRERRFSRWLHNPKIELHKVWVTDKCFGPVYLALAQVQTAKGIQRWAILSDEPTDLNTFLEYGLRFDIEEGFLDDKPGGFQLESSELFDVHTLTRLGFIMATATLYLVQEGINRS